MKPVLTALLSVAVTLPFQLWAVDLPEPHIPMAGHAAHSMPAAGTEKAVDNKSEFERRDAMAVSQAVIGRQVGAYHFYDSHGQPTSLERYRGKPLVISLIYTSCYHICPTTTQNLKQVVRKAEAVLGTDQFNVISVGFDTRNDSADAMRHFASQQGVSRDNWQFLATDQQTVDAFSKDLGFLFYPSPQGFDHLIQTSLLDREGRVYRQIYGVEFDTPLLVEPLKELVFGEEPSQTFYHQISNKVRLFCTVYDPATDSYRFDYSIFVGLLVGLSIGAVMIYLWLKEWRASTVQGQEQISSEN